MLSVSSSMALIFSISSAAFALPASLLSLRTFCHSLIRCPAFAMRSLFTCISPNSLFSFEPFTVMSSTSRISIGSPSLSAET